MNPRIVRGLLYEHITRTWPFFAAGLIISLSMSSIWLIGPDATSQQDLEPVTQAIALFIVAIGLLYTVADGERMTCDIPQRILSLPASSFEITSIKVLFTAAGIALQSLTIHILLTLFANEPRDPWYAYVVFAVCVAAIIQTVALAAGCLGDWSLGILIAAFGLIVGYADNVLFDLEIRVSALSVSALAPLVLAVCIPISWGLVHLRRTGRWDPELLLAWRSVHHTAITDRVLSPFDSPLAAQRWFEARRMRNHFWVTFVCSYALVGTANVIPRIGTERFLEDYSTADRIFWAMGQFGMMLPFIFLLSALFTGGVMVLQNIRLQIGPMSAFLFLRPMSTANLARGRLQGTAHGLAAPLLVTTVLTIALCATWGLIEEPNPLSLLTDRYSALEIIAIITIIALGIAAAAWAAYWTVLICLGAVLYTLYSLTLNALGLALFGESAVMAWNSTMLFPSFVACVGLVTLALIAIAIRREHLSPLRLVVVIPAVCGAAAFWFATHWDDIWSAHEVNWSPGDWPQYALFAILLTAPIATIPLTLNWARHR